MFTSFITTAPTYVCLFWAILLLMDYRDNRSNGKRILFWYMLTCSVLYFAHYCYFGHYLQLLVVTDCLFPFANLAVFPLFYIYVRKITTNRLSAKGVVLHLLPALVICPNLPDLPICTRDALDRAQTLSPRKEMPVGCYQKICT